jgi:hypothetical protein
VQIQYLNKGLNYIKLLVLKTMYNRFNKVLTPYTYCRFIIGKIKNIHHHIYILDKNFFTLFKVMLPRLFYLLITN